MLSMWTLWSQEVNICIDAKATKNFFMWLFKVLYCVWNVFPFSFQTLRSKYCYLQISKSEQSCTNSNSFLFNFKALAYAVHMAGDGTKRSCVPGLLLFNYTVKASLEWQPGPGLSRICLPQPDQGEPHFFYQKMNDGFSSKKWWGKRNHNTKAIDQNRLFRVLYQYYTNYHSLISQIFY